MIRPRPFGRFFFPAILAIAFAACNHLPPENDDLSLEEKTLAGLYFEAVEIGDALGDSVWPGFSSAPKEAVLQFENRDILVCPQQERGEGNKALHLSVGKLTCPAFSHEPILPMKLQASLNIFGAPETIVSAGPETFGQRPAEWIIKILHERFHQWQSTSARYQERIAALDLADGDETGMWMLNYEFPYDDSKTAQDFRALGVQLHKTKAAIGSADFDRELGLYRRTRRKAFSDLPPQARRYVEFQLWKEGVARWTEMAIARAAADGGGARADVFGAELAALEKENQKILLNLDLPTLRRGAFYEIGAAEAETINNFEPGWRDEYAGGELSLERFWGDVGER